MRVIVTARHCEIPEALRHRAEEQVRKAAKKAHRPQRAQVVFDADHQLKVVEIQVSLPRGQVHVATGEARTFRSALDRASAKLLHQFDKTGAQFSRRKVSG